MKRWMLTKLETDKRRALARRAVANAKAGLHERFRCSEDDPDRAVTSWDLTPARATNAIVPAYIPVKVVACTGATSSEHKRSRFMRKARGGPVRLWTGTDGRKGNLAPPPMTGFLQSCWTADTEWKIYKKGD